MEVVAGFLAVILLLWVCSGNSKTEPEYSVQKTNDDRYFEVVNNKTGEVEFIGTEQKCQEWIAKRNDNQ